MKNNYKINKNTKLLKDQCIAYFKELLNRNCEVKLSRILPYTKNIKKLMRDLEDKYVKKEN